MKFVDIFKKALDAEQLVKLTLSKPRIKKGDVKNYFIRPVELKGTLMYQSVARTATQDFTENHDAREILDLVEGQLREHFYNATLWTVDATYHYLQSKKGKETLKKKPGKNAPLARQHNRSKEYLVSAEEPWLKALGIASESGKIYADKQAKYRQINRFIEVVDNLIQQQSLSTIYDMGSGKGYLTFALYSHLAEQNPAVEVTGVEVRQDLVDKCNRVANDMGFSGLRFQLGSIEDYEVQEADMIIALHACDIATDMAIAKGIKTGAQYIIVAPCCQKQVRTDMDLPRDNPLAELLQHGILLERQAVMITDGIRAMMMEKLGYETKVFEFISTEHTAKNIMITAAFTGKQNEHLTQEIKQLKAAFGVKRHYLEELLTDKT